MVGTTLAARFATTMDHALWLRNLMRGLSTRLDGQYDRSFGRWIILGKRGTWRWSVVPINEESWVLSLSLMPSSPIALHRGEEGLRTSFVNERWMVSAHGGELHLATRITWADRLEIDADRLEWTHHRASALLERAERVVLPSRLGDHAHDERERDERQHDEREHDEREILGPEASDNRDASRPSTLRPPQPGPSERVELRATKRTPSDPPRTHVSSELVTRKPRI